MEYYSALTPATTEMNLEDVTLSEISQSQKNQTLPVSTSMKCLKESIQKIRERKGGCRAPEGGRNGELLPDRHEVSAEQDEKCPGICCLTLYLESTMLYCALKDQ